MPNEYKTKAYAKINLNLRVLPKRGDGFHSIESIFQTINLYDELVVSVCDKAGCSIKCENFDLPQKNTLITAFQAFMEISGKVPGIELRLKKGIPSGGGLGGGSSDAAAFIRVLEKISGNKLSVSQLDYIAAKTGSDVFFFMHCDDEGKGCALVSGRGENIKTIVPRDDLFILLLFPNVSSSTKEAYALVDEVLAKRDDLQYPTFSDLEVMYRQSPKEWRFTNTFTPVLCKRYADVCAAIGDLKKSSAEYTDMSGSGSTVFGVFTNEQEAVKSCRLLGKTWKCELVQTI